MNSHLAWIPNALTSGRLLITPLIGYLIVNSSFGYAGGLLGMAGLSDGLDGIIARRYRIQSRLGSYLDPLVDKLLVGVVYFALGSIAVLPWWLVGLVIGRDMMIITFVGRKLLRSGSALAASQPSVVSKFNTLLQVVLAGGVLIALAYDYAQEPFIAGLISVLTGVVAVTTVWSGAAYIRGAVLARG